MHEKPSTVYLSKYKYKVKNVEETEGEVDLGLGSVTRERRNKNNTVTTASFISASCLVSILESTLGFILTFT